MIRAGYPKAEHAALLLILALEFWIFSGAHEKFFNHDSLFYVIHHPRSWQQFARLLAAPDVSQQYRPLTLGAMSLAAPFFGTDPRPYHWIPLAFHLANTCLFFLLARRLLPTVLGALAAAAFWGLHSAAAWVTYDVGYFPDFLMSFFALSALISAVEGYRRRSGARYFLALLLYLAALLCKEAMVALPLALWIALLLADWKDSPRALSLRELMRTSRKAMPVIAMFIAAALLHAFRLALWLRSGALYAQGPSQAYDIGPFANLTGKLHYLYWALNLPDALSIPRAGRYRAGALLLMGLLFFLWLADIFRRRGKPSAIEIGGGLWLAAMLAPALLLSSRTAKWYLYVPAMGLALALGALAGNLEAALAGLRRAVAYPAIFALFLVPAAFSTYAQTRSFLAASDPAFQSAVLADFLRDFRSEHPALPPQATLFFLPSFNADVLRLLAAEPIDRGQLFELYYPESRVRAAFAHKGERLPADYRERTDLRILYYLDGRLYDVTEAFRRGGRLTLHFLATLEGKVPPLLEKEPVGGRRLHDDYVSMRFADRGDPLPDDYAARADLMIFQYLMGHFHDVSPYYKGRRRDTQARRVIEDLSAIEVEVSREEFYPSYERFATPTGAPIFWATPDRDIVTQIGGSTAVIPLGTLPGRARLIFDISWMYDQGDGAWAAIAVRSDGHEETLFRRYMNPNPKGKGLTWEEVLLDLGPYAGKTVDLVLSCRNSPGNTTIADWLNWRDLRLK
jgi:hypothetical protein